LTEKDAEIDKIKDNVFATKVEWERQLQARLVEYTAWQL
jgi:hypothetical protein